MNKTLIFLLALTTINAFADEPAARKAIINCDFNLSTVDDGKLSYTIDLDTRNVILNCVNTEYCMLDGNEREHNLTSHIEKNASFSPIFSTSEVGKWVHTNMQPLNIEGSNGDDMDMFTRITFDTDKINGEWKLKATAVLIFADFGNDGEVSAPTKCSVNVF